MTSNRWWNLTSGALLAAGLVAGCSGPGAGGVEPVDYPGQPVAADAKQEDGAPAAALKPDSFDAPAPSSVREAEKAADNVPDGDIRHIVPGTDREHNPSPQPRLPDVPAARSSRDSAPPAKPAARPAQPAARPAQRAPEKAALYACPMHPEVTSDKPGTCPKCGMALVKRSR